MSKAKEVEAKYEALFFHQLSDKEGNYERNVLLDSALSVTGGEFETLEKQINCKNEKLRES